MLLGTIGRDRISSSYIFCGEPGIGKKMAAVNFAKALNCLAPVLSTGDACDACSSCSKIDSGSHPDIVEISPDDSDDDKKKSRIIKIEDIRAIGEALSYKPFEARQKVVIVDEAETMNLSAANAFLKTLEEPPEKSVIILVTSRPDMLPATVLSRCCRISFFPLSEKASKQVLAGRFSGAPLEALHRLSMGRPGEAFSSDLLEERDWFVEMLDSMLKAGKDAWVSREDMDKWFGQALIVMRDIAVLKITGDPGLMVNADLKDYLAGLSKSVDLKVILYLYNELAFLKGQLIFNLNKSITWNYTASMLRKELLI